MEKGPVKTGSLFVVATPIGNLEDITLRALRVLKEASIIAAEDTRVAKKLLAHYGIAGPVTSYFEHNEMKKAPVLIEKMKNGADVALISDAGTPGISDPGYRLIRLALDSSIPVVPIPGPSALISVLSVSGMALDEFTFKGFVPSSPGERKRFFLGMRGRPHTYVMYEAARRLHETLEAALEALGDADAVIGREMTKLYEEVLRGKLRELMERLKGRDLKGELALVLRTGDELREGRDLAVEIEKLLRAGMGVKEASKALSVEFDMPGAEIYKEALRVKGALKP